MIESTYSRDLSIIVDRPTLLFISSISLLIFILYIHSLNFFIKKAFLNFSFRIVRTDDNFK